MMNRMVFRNGCLIDPATQSESIADLFVAEGKIVGIDEKPADFQQAEEIDCQDCLIAPGFIDLHTAVREPGYSHKGTLHSELSAAVKGGFTQVCLPPDSDPVLDTPSVAEWLHHQAQRLAKAQVLPIGALTHNLAGLQLSEMAALKEAGCVALSQTYFPMANTQLLFSALQYAATQDLLVIHYPIDAAWQQKAYVHAGKENLHLGLAGMPIAAEVAEITRVLALLPETGARVHFARVSSSRGVELIADAKARGFAVTADVSIHHLFFTESVYRDFEGYWLQPPLRSEADKEALRQGVVNGTLDAISSAHEPQDADSLLAPLVRTPAGMSAIELVWPLLVQLHRELNLSWCQSLNAITEGPARILGLNRGRLRVGQVADLTVLSPTAKWQVCSETLVSHGKNTPLLGQTVTGQVKATYVRGVKVYDGTTQ